MMRLRCFGQPKVFTMFHRAALPRACTQSILLLRVDKGIAAGTAGSSDCREGHCGNGVAEDVESRRPEEGSQVSSWRVDKGIAAGSAESGDCREGYCSKELPRMWNPVEKGIAAGTAESSDCRERYCGKGVAEDVESRKGFAG